MANDTTKVALPKSVVTTVLNKVNDASTIAALSPSTPQKFADSTYLVFNPTAEAEVGEMSEAEEPDYKALYEAEKAHSRKWEKQAKANKGAASALDEANEAKKSADEKIAELEKRLDAKEKAEQRAKAAAKVAQEKGVPADLIVGDDEESMAEWADKMLAAFKKKPAPSVQKPGSFAKDDGKDRTELRDFASALLGNKQ